MQSKITADLIEHMDNLKVLLTALDEANALPEMVTLENCNFKIPSIVVKRQAHSALMAELNRFKNAVASIEKPRYEFS